MSSITRPGIERPLRIALGWQLVLTMLLAAVCGWVAGMNGAISAILGGAVAMAGGLAFSVLASPRNTGRQSAGDAWDGLTRMLKAEAAKVGIIIILLWLVLATYKKIMVLGFIGTFILAVIIFSMAIFIRNPVSLETGENHVD
ncbi:MAG: ATP synthase subunit I [Betaproteobacteria bacterium]|nr:ATP synthase subunit I [Betaproteobacteria bacterium]